MAISDFDKSIDLNPSYFKVKNNFDSIKGLYEKSWFLHGNRKIWASSNRFSESGWFESWHEKRNAGKSLTSLKES